MTQPIRIQLHPAQKRFRDSKALYRAFCGGRGAGKSYVGALDLLLRAAASPGRLFMTVAPTYPMLKDGSLRTFTELARRLELLKGMNKSELRATLNNGAEVLFRSADEPDRLRGPNLSGAWMDEASLITREAFDIVIACLREGGRQGWLSATFTPRGKSHWTFEQFGTGRPDSDLIHSRTLDNPFLPTTFADTLRQQYTSAMARQELGGEFTDLEGALFKRHWFPIVDALPNGLRFVRSWDLAATAAKPGTDPDWTAGLKMGRAGNRGDFFIADIRRVRETPQNVERLIEQTAAVDGRATSILMEQEPGSSGVALIASYRRLLAGYIFVAERASGDKTTRALPLAAQAEAGNVKLLAGPWNAAFLDEIEAFPFGPHDDQVDAASSALDRLTKPVSVSPPRAYGGVRAVAPLSDGLGGLPRTWDGGPWRR